MKINGYAKRGQTRCYECGSEFIVTVINSYNATISCPQGHNYGSWMEFTPSENYCIPFVGDATKLRRQIEDRLRKDRDFFLKVASDGAYNPAI